mmetsp:Transcript_13532/g.36166  ORF Transcript_13532/g.36166 Transcript_13532/m.36166 type:complete len:224 (-) Transcript_13532:533-1204(-)
MPGPPMPPMPGPPMRAWPPGRLPPKSAGSRTAAGGGLPMPVFGGPLDALKAAMMLALAASGVAVGAWGALAGWGVRPNPLLLALLLLASPEVTPGGGRAAGVAVVVAGLAKLAKRSTPLPLLCCGAAGVGALEKLPKPPGVPLLVPADPKSAWKAGVDEDAVGTAAGCGALPNAAKPPPAPPPLANGSMPPKGSALALAAGCVAGVALPRPPSKSAAPPPDAA